MQLREQAQLLTQQLLVAVEQPPQVLLVWAVPPVAVEQAPQARLVWAAPLVAVEQAPQVQLVWAAPLVLLQAPQQQAWGRAWGLNRGPP